MSNETEMCTVDMSTVSKRSEFSLEAAASVEGGRGECCDLEAGSRDPNISQPPAELQDAKVHEGLLEKEDNSRPERNAAIDLHRGIIMFMMVLSHVSLFVSGGSRNASPFQNDYWYDALHQNASIDIDHPVDVFEFIQRKWIDSSGAPSFCFIMGHALLYSLDSLVARGRSGWSVFKFFACRALILAGPASIAAHWLKSVFTHTWNGDILFGLGGALFFSASVLVPLRSMEWFRRYDIDAPVSGLFAVLLAVVNQLCVKAAVRADYKPSLLEAMLLLPYGPGPQDAVESSGVKWRVQYCIVQCLIMVFAGTCFGRLDKSLRASTRGWGLRLAFPGVLSAVFFALFVLVRAHDGWSNTNSIGSQTGAGLSYVTAFGMMVKYPFSISLLLYGLGSSLLHYSFAIFCEFVLRNRGGVTRERWLFRPALDLGEASLMGYIFHLNCIAVVALLFLKLVPVVQPSLWAIAAFVYLGIFPALLLLTMAVCRWWGSFKRRKPAGSLWRML